MTAHRTKPTLTRDRVSWFADYYRREPEWGVFHVALSDGNYHCGAADNMLRPGTGRYVNGTFVPARYDFGRDEWPADVREQAEWFEALTPSQRRRLGQKVEDIANTVVKM